MAGRRAGRARGSVVGAAPRDACCRTAVDSSGHSDRDPDRCSPAALVESRRHHALRVAPRASPSRTRGTPSTAAVVRAGHTQGQDRRARARCSSFRLRNPARYVVDRADVAPPRNPSRRPCVGVLVGRPTRAGGGRRGHGARVGRRDRLPTCARWCWRSRRRPDGDLEPTHRPGGGARHGDHVEGVVGAGGRSTRSGSRSSVGGARRQDGASKDVCSGYGRLGVRPRKYRSSRPEREMAAR